MGPATANPCGWVGYCGIRVPHENHMRVEELPKWLSEHPDAE